MKVFKHISLWNILLAAFMTVAVVVVVFILSFAGPVEFERGSIVLPDGSTIPVEIADSTAEQRQGLMGRQQMDADSGMLFIFSTPGTYTFWMENTKLDLDFIWLLSGTVIDLRTHVPAGDGLPSDQVVRIQPAQPADAVLEVPAGFVDRHSIEIGDQLVYQLP